MIKQIYADYQPQISYSRFCRHLQLEIGQAPEIALRLVHIPGEKIQVDFCDGLNITDHKSGKTRKTQIFVGVLPFSSYCFGTFVEDQKLHTFIRAHEAMWCYLGGITPYVVIDNLKAGVKKAHLYDPEVNLTYCDYGNHCRFAVLPARPYTPRARFRNICQLEDWDTSYDRGLPPAKFKELSVLNFYHKLENLIIVGKTGVGKTHLGLALGNRICQDANSTLFFSMNLLFEELQSERIAGRYIKYIRKLTSAKALILDDFGLRSYTHAEASSLLEVLEERYSKGVTIITSQILPKGWIALFEDPVIAEAIVDRLCNPANVISLVGDSYRKKRKQS